MELEKNKYLIIKIISDLTNTISLFFRMNRTRIHYNFLEENIYAHSTEFYGTDFPVHNKIFLMT